MTVRDEAYVIRHALALGALGYVSKEDAGEELLPAVRSSLEGRAYLSTNPREALATHTKVKSFEIIGLHPSRRRPAGRPSHP